MKAPASVLFNKDQPSDFGAIMLHQLERSFDAKETGHGFYFHGSLEKWESLFLAVIENTDIYFESLKNDQPELWLELEAKDLQGAYQEYVISLLNAAIELESVETLLERSIENPLVMAITACKENIDRGGMENTKYIYNRLHETEEEDRLPLILGAMHSRALSTRDRIILKSRMPQILNYMKTTSPKTFKEQQTKLFEVLGHPPIESEYHPHLYQVRAEAAGG